MQNHRVNLKLFKFLINHFGEINMKLFLGAAVIAATSLVAVSANADKLRWKMQSMKLQEFFQRDNQEK